MGDRVTKMKNQFANLVSREEVATGVGVLRREITNAQNEALVFKEVALLTHEKLKDTVVELNTILKIYCFDSNVRVVFGVQSTSDQGYLWKASVKILCFKIHSSNDSFRITRRMNLVQFWKLRQDILRQVETRALTENGELQNLVVGTEDNHNEATGGNSQSQYECGQRQLTTENVLARVDAIVDDQSECCICMERKFDISLPCAHSFCRTCINQWSDANNDANKTCPTCRQQIEAPEDIWEMPDAPAIDEIRHYVVSLASGT